jgi:hypothetical protein
MTEPTNHPLLQRTRRHFFRDCGVGVGTAAPASLPADETRADESRAAGPEAAAGNPAEPLAPKPPHHPAKARSVIFLFMAGGNSQIDLFDPKPKLQELSGKPLPESLLKGKRFAFLEGVPDLLGSKRVFARHGRSGAEFSELLPHTASIADDIAVVRSMVTDVFNHGPAKLFVNTGSPQFNGRPSMGAWVTYGIGSACRDLPGFVVLQSGPRGPRGGAPLWGSGFLPTAYQGVPFRSVGDPVLNLSAPKGVTPAGQRDVFDAVVDLNRLRLADTGDPEIAGRIAQYELAYRMQTSAPDLIDISREPAKVLADYGAEPGKASFANNCLLARRLVERGVRFVQLYHTDWDHHGDPANTLTKGLELRCRETDRPAAARGAGRRRPPVRGEGQPPPAAGSAQVGSAGAVPPECRSGLTSG